MENKNIFNRIATKIKKNPGMFIQKTVFVVALIFAIVFFLYALLFSSNWAKIITNEKEHSGFNFFIESQAFNSLILLLSALTLVVTALAFAFSSNSRKKYYLSNIVLNSILAASFIANSVVCFINLPGLRAMYNLIDPYAPEYSFGDISKWTASGKVKSDNIFIVGLILAVIFIIVAAAIITTLLLKLKAQEERKIMIEKMVKEHE